MNKKKLKISVLVLTVMLLVSPLFFLKNGDKKIAKNNNEETADIVKNDKSIADLIFFRAYPYKNVELKGDNLIDGIYGNRTVYMFKTNGIDNIESINYINGDKTLSFNNYVFKKDGQLYIFSATDNIVDPATQKITITINGSNNGHKVSSTQEVKTEKLSNNAPFIVSDPKTIYSKSDNKHKYVEIIKEYDIINLDIENPLIKEKNIKIDKNIMKNIGIPSEINYNISDFGSDQITNIVGVKSAKVSVKLFTTKEDIETENKINSVIKSIDLKI